MLRVNPSHAPLGRLSAAIALVGALAAATMALIELDRFDAALADERIYQVREVQEGLSALHRDLEMLGHLMNHPSDGPTAEARDYIAARRDQLAVVRWLGHLHGGEVRPEVLLASGEMRGYDPRRDPAVAPLLSAVGEHSLAAAIPGSHRNSASLALVIGENDDGRSALVALVDGNALLNDSLKVLNRATAALDLRLDGHRVGHWPHLAQIGGWRDTDERQPVFIGTLELTVELAAPGATVTAWQVLPQPLVVLAGAMIVAALVAAAGRRVGGVTPAAAPPPPPAAPHERHRDRLWRLGELTATLAHDLGQPLNVIRLTAEAAQDAHEHGRLEDARLTRALANTVDQALRAQAMIDGLVCVTRRPNGPPGPLQPVELVRRVLGRNLEQLKGQGVRLRWSADLSVPPVLGHAAKLEAAVQHLLTNACEALATRRVDCGDAGTVWVACRRDGDGVAIEVADDGPGFPPELLPLIDDPLAEIPERSKGCGLGLAVVLGVAAEMGGRFSIAAGQPGTRAILLLPPSRRSLLLVEDDVAAAETLAGHLEGRGWRVRLAHGGNPALAMFRQEPTDAVVTDLHMTDGDGWQLIEHLRALAPDLPIMAISTADGDDARRAVTCGAAVVLRKPLRLQEVCEELEGLFTVV